MTIVTDRVSQAADNCHDTGNGNHPGFSSAGVLYFGNDPDALWMGMNWGGIAIPDGATITNGANTFVQLTDVSFGSGGTFTMVMIGHETTTDTDWTNGDGPPDRSAAETAATLSWAASWAHLATFNSPSMHAVIQEIVDATSGEVTDLTLVLEDIALSTVNRDVEGYGSTAAEAPYVSVEYTGGGGGGSLLLRQPRFPRALLIR